MRYVVTVNDATLEVTLEPDRVRIGDTTLDARLAGIDGTPVSVLTIGNVMRRVVVRRGSERGQYTLWIEGFRYEVEALDERTSAIRALARVAAGAAAPAALRAPMPGLVVRVHVVEGDTVRAGQSLVVMEAMKMENELRAPAAGRVKAVLARAGSAVEKGAVLVELE